MMGIQCDCCGKFMRETAKHVHVTFQAKDGGKIMSNGVVQRDFCPNCYQKVVDAIEANGAEK